MDNYLLNNRYKQLKINLNQWTDIDEYINNTKTFKLQARAEILL